MTNWIKTRNNTKVNLSDIPELSINDLRNEIILQAKRPVGFFGKDWEWEEQNFL